MADFEWSFERDPEMNMAQKIAHGSSAKHMLSKFDRGTDLGLRKTEMRVRQELWKAVEEKVSGTSEGSTSN